MDQGYPAWMPLTLEQAVELGMDPQTAARFTGVHTAVISPTGQHARQQGAPSSSSSQRGAPSAGSRHGRAATDNVSSTGTSATTSSSSGANPSSKPDGGRVSAMHGDKGRPARSSQAAAAPAADSDDMHLIPNSPEAAALLGVSPGQPVPMLQAMETMFSTLVFPSQQRTTADSIGDVTAAGSGQGEVLDSTMTGVSTSSSTSAASSSSSGMAKPMAQQLFEALLSQSLGSALEPEAPKASTGGTSSSVRTPGSSAARGSSSAAAGSSRQHSASSSSSSSGSIIIDGLLQALDRYLQESVAKWDGYCSCSDGCKCAATSSDLLGAARRCASRVDAQASLWRVVVQMLTKVVPIQASRVLDPAGGHKLAAVQGVLTAFREHILLTIYSKARSADTAAGGRQLALDVALACSRAGLCAALSKQLQALSDQWQAACGAMDNARGSGRSRPTVSGDRTVQALQARTQHLLAQQLLLYQWTAALCRVWPSNTPDAAALQQLLGSALASAATWMQHLPHIQLLSGSPAPGNFGQSQPTSGRAALQGAARAGWPSQQLLAVPVTAAVLEVAALVLQPLGVLLQREHQLQLDRLFGQSSDPSGVPPADSLSVPASYLCAVLNAANSQGCISTLLHAMLTVCLHQLTLHAERKLAPAPASSKHQQQPSGCSTSHQSSSPVSSDTVADSNSTSTSTSSASTAGRGSGGCGRSTAELAEGYLLQHADTLQATPCDPLLSRAAVLALKAACERQWAAWSLPLTLQATAQVMATATQTNSAAASGLSDTDSSSSSISAVWDMQDWGRFSGQFGDSSCLGATASEAVSRSSSGAGGGSGVTAGSTTTPASGSHAATPASDSVPLLSIDSCLQTAAALSAVFRNSTRGKHFVSLARTLLATAAVAASLADTQVQSLSGCQLSGGAEAARRRGDIVLIAAAAATALMPLAKVRPAGSSPAAASADRQVPAGDVWGCLSLAAHLTQAMLQLDRQAAQPAVCSSFRCANLVPVLLPALCELQCSTDPATQQQQLQSVAYTLQVLEAAMRQQEAGSGDGVPSAGDDSQQAPFANRYTCTAGHSVGAGAVKLLSQTDPAVVLGSLQGQLLLQACTSLLLTCSSIMHSGRHTITPDDLDMCVQLLVLLQRAGPKTGAQSSAGCGLSESLAAVLALTGRYLVALGAALSPPAGKLDSIAGSSPSTGPGVLGSSSGEGLRSLSLFHQWLWACGEECGSYTMQLGAAYFESKPRIRAASRELAGILQKATQRLVSFVCWLNQAVQQADAAAPPAGAPDTAATGKGPHNSSASSAEPDQAAAAWGAADACNPAQQQLPLGRLLGMDAAQGALEKLLPHLDAAAAPYLEQGVGALLVPDAATAAATLQLPAAFTAAGEALCAAVPCSACCANPRCTSLRGVSAGFALVRGAGCVCGGCLGLREAAGATAAAVGVPQGSAMAARYCSRSCQAAHWQQHKEVCGRLGRAQLAAAAVVAPKHAD